MTRLRTPPVSFAATTVQLRRRKPRMGAQSPSSPKRSEKPKWNVATAPDRYLRLSHTLPIGQAFRWADCGTHDHPAAFQGVAREWAGAIGNCLVVLRQADVEPPDHMEDPVWYRFLVGAREGIVEDYLRLDHDVSKIMAACCANDDAFAKVFPYLKGVRVVRTEPVECLFSFICSSNNNVKRITSMVRWLAERYGTELGVYQGCTHYQFPTVEALSREADEAELREAGFGYRAKYIVGAAKQLQIEARNVGVSAEEMLLTWRSLDRENVARKLVAFPGIGRKVASCIGLFSLDKFGEVPCDTHIWQIANRYLPHLKQKSLTERVYDEVGDHFRGKFGKNTAGLAQTILFVGELPDFKKSLPGNEKSTTRKKRKRAPIFVKEESNIVKEEKLVASTAELSGGEGRTLKREKLPVNDEWREDECTFDLHARRASKNGKVEAPGMAKEEATVYIRMSPSGANPMPK
eukprot:GFKZ01013309.1.p1 GENE.GFKZ01013309.1~~GFKZ01013309.1.p1  ORF type:complete len:463 (-),score=49.70 GFKZ01013309.1:423-1811(-)